MTTDPGDRLLDLLTAEATQRLSPAETRELADLLRRYPDAAADADSLALAAAAADLALMDDTESLPPTLAARLNQQAVAYFAASPPPTPRAPGTSRGPMLAWLGWVVAAGLAGVLIWTNWPQPSAERQFAKMAERPGVREFTGNKDGATGTVRWDEAKQEGFVEVRGLTALDPTKNQYQLWIVTPDQKQPVDGGVFDVKPDGTAVIPVKAALRVKDAQAFAITKEKPGGVVVTDKTVPEMNLVMAPPKA
jgi:anti-sigma-K factor RskA